MEIPVQGLDQQPEGEGESGTQLCSAGSALSFLLKCRSGGGGLGAERAAQTLSVQREAKYLLKSTIFIGYLIAVSASSHMMSQLDFDSHCASVPNNR